MPEKEKNTYLTEEVQAVCSPLLGIAESVAAVIPAREKDFIDLGEDLQHVTSCVRDLAGLSSELNEKASGEGVQSAIEELAGQLEQIENIWDRSMSDSISLEIGTIEETISAVQVLLEQFKRIVRHLKALKMTTLIESARLGGSGSSFSTLADDVEKLANKIVSDAGQIQERTSNLNTFMASVRFSTGEMSRMFETCTRQASGTLGKNIKILAELVQKSRDGAHRLDWRMQEISEKSSEIVASLQFHDITRQQVEHVHESLREVLDLVNDPEDAVQLDTAEIAAWVKDVCGLQAHQLEHARSSFIQAVDQILSNMNGVAESIGFLCADVSETIGMDRGSGRSSLGTISEAMEQVAECMRDSARHGRGIGKTMEEFATKVEDMSTFVSEIEDVGSEIELISLNASIKAAHTGSNGAALGVIASAIQKLSVDAREHTEQVIPLLKRLSTSSRNLHEITAKVLDVSRVEDMLERHECAVKELNEINEGMTSLLDRIVGKGISLEGEVAGIRAKVTFHEGVNQQLGELKDNLNAVLLELEEHFPGDGVQVRSERLQKIFQRYTMESERLIHKAMNGEESEPDADENIELFESDESEFGENVELF
ncbi:MAG: methyl-accepting chemotaxis protein [Desulfovibrionales bacterium]